MANTKTSDLPAADAVPTDEVMIRRGSENFRASVASLVEPGVETDLVITDQLLVGTASGLSTVVIIGDTEPDGTAANALSVVGLVSMARTETVTNDNRPVIFPITYTVDPPTPPEQLTDYHGIDTSMQTTAADIDLSDVNLYPLESAARHYGEGALKGLYAGYLLARNHGAGSVTAATCLRLQIQNSHANGDIEVARGLYMADAVNKGTMDVLYGIYLAAFSAATLNYGVYSLCTRNFFAGIEIGDHVSPTAACNLPAGTSAQAPLRILDGVAPSSPNNGEIWSDGNDLYVRLAGTTYTLNKTAV